MTISGDSRSVTDTFGVHVNATYCNDGQLDSDLIEWEIPPLVPPTGFDFFWIDHRQGSTCLGIGQHNHIQEGGKRDTFKLHFDWIDSAVYPLTISWPHPVPWSSSLTISEVSGDSIRSVADMLIDSSIEVSDRATNALLIIGDPVTLDVQDFSSHSPQEFVLLQNYPNPFNSSTIMRYHIGTRASISLRVYDVLGNEIATLVNATQEPGEHSMQYNAAPLSSGIYVSVLRSGRFAAVKPFIVLK